MKKIFSFIIAFVLILTLASCKLFHKEEVFTVSFETNGGTEIQPIKVKKDKNITVELITTKERHSFDGWFKEADLENEWVLTTEKVKEDVTLYAKWKNIVTEVPNTPANIGLTGAFLGGNINDFPKADVKEGSRTDIAKRYGSPSPTVSVPKPGTGAMGAFQRFVMSPMGLTNEENKELFIYFNWDGSFNWIEDYTHTVDTSREDDGQLKQYYNIKDYYDLEDYQVFVNYIRFRIVTKDTDGKLVKPLFQEGQAVTESSSGSSFILRKQSVNYNNGGTPEEKGDDSFDIAIAREEMDAVLTGYLENDPEAYLEVIGVQLFIAHKDKMLLYWNEDEVEKNDNEVYRNGEKNPYALYDEAGREIHAYSQDGQTIEHTFIVGSGKSIVSYYDAEGTDKENVPQKRFTEYNGQRNDFTEEEFKNFLGLIKVFYKIENENPEETIVLNQDKIEFSGGSREPVFGMQLDKNPDAPEDIVYYTLPIQANTMAVYDRNEMISIYDEYSEEEIREEAIDKTKMRQFEFLIFITLKESKNLPYTIKGTNIYDEIDGWTQHPLTKNFIPEGTRDLVALYSIQYGQDGIYNLLTHEWESTNIKINMDHSTSWKYQGNIPIKLPEGIAKEDIEIHEFTSYAYYSNDFDILRDGQEDSVELLKGLESENITSRRVRVTYALETNYTKDENDGSGYSFPFTIMNTVSSYWLDDGLLVKKERIVKDKSKKIISRNYSPDRTVINEQMDYIFHYYRDPDNVPEEELREKYRDMLLNLKYFYFEENEEFPYTTFYPAVLKILKDPESNPELYEKYKKHIWEMLGIKKNEEVPLGD